MRKRLITALVGVALSTMPMAPAHASLTLVGILDGNQCGGTGGFTACWASGTLYPNGAVAKTPGGSPSIIRIERPDNGSSNDKSTAYPTIAGNELVIGVSGNILTYTYTQGPGDPDAHFLGLFNGGGAAAGQPSGQGFQNTYFLFYDPNPITTGTIDLSTYFANPGWSHVDIFDSGTAVPEPATWAMMLLGFAGIGLTMHRRRKPVLAQLA